MGNILLTIDKVQYSFYFTVLIYFLCLVLCCCGLLSVTGMSWQVSTSRPARESIPDTKQNKILETASTDNYSVERDVCLADTVENVILKQQDSVQQKFQYIMGNVTMIKDEFDVVMGHHANELKKCDTADADLPMLRDLDEKFDKYVGENFSLVHDIAIKIHDTVKRMELTISNISKRVIDMENDLATGDFYI